MMQEKGDYQTAEETYQQAIAIMREATSSESWGLAKMLSNLGLLRADQGRYTDAEQLERQAMEMRQKLGGSESPDMSTSLIKVALVRSLQHDPTIDDPLLRRALEIRKKEMTPGASCHRLGGDSPGRSPDRRRSGGGSGTLLRQAVAEMHAVQFPLTAWQAAEADCSGSRTGSRGTPR